MPELCKLSRIADVIEYGLAREVLFRMGYGAVRDGDYLKVYGKREIGSYSLYVNECRREMDGHICDIYVDEGFQHDCLTSDGKVGVNKGWMEMCSMNDLLRLIVAKLDPEHDIESSPFIGRGSTARHYHEQYVAAIDELGSGTEMFTQNFDWPMPEKENQDISELEGEVTNG